MKNLQKNNKNKLRITAKDYVKAVKKADREIELTGQAGWKSIHKIHKSKKLYDRKLYKKNLGGED
ncbi:hypothetical protein [Paludibacter sp.]|uniref:hypothetical protein n=1 Tax=Paludibacter sp. TaxID=1898105 RepID=UPI00135483F1|nr:hypothetical protein [Paludibacter sp.]MTK53531.1 hypothetical protein [Paludibacter sp.]